jgi:hypothetical protein
MRRHRSHPPFPRAGADPGLGAGPGLGQSERLESPMGLARLMLSDQRPPQSLTESAGVLSLALPDPQGCGRTWRMSGPDSLNP